MTFYFPYAAFTLEDVLDGKINQKNFSESERYVLNFVREWFAGKDNFIFRTSGSTGAPKEILLSREQIRYSAQETLRFLFPNDSPKRMLLCIDPRNIGGTQMITRAILASADLVMVSPKATPLENTEGPFDLVAMVPMQVVATELDHFALVKNVLIGGADLDVPTRESLQSVHGTTFFQTYGMTETASHIAVREISQPLYRTLGDVQIAMDDRDCLRCYGTVTGYKWLQTNDVISIATDGFVWKGRADWVINSGGVKIHPELIEEIIGRHFPECVCAITSVPDATLGQKVVLITTMPLLDHLKASNLLGRYEMPKREIIVEDFPRLENAKIDRLAITHLAAMY